VCERERERRLSFTFGKAEGISVFDAIFNIVSFHTVCIISIVQINGGWIAQLTLVSNCEVNYKY